MKYLPLFVDVSGKSVVVVGGGHVAERKVSLLLSAGARVTVVAPRIVEAIRARAEGQALTIVQQPFEARLLAGAKLAVAATNDRDVNAAVAAAGEALGILVNAVDDPALSNCIVPAIVDRDPLIIAIGTGGTAPVLARTVRSRIEALIDDSVGRLARFLEDARDRIRSQVRDVGARRAFYESLLRGPIPRLLAAHRNADAHGALEAALATRVAERVGRVIVVGAGPGDPGLLTLNALRALQAADVVLHDQLVSPEILAYARRDAVLVPVGKAAGRPSTPQEDINALLVTHARAGSVVVRLKGGDPFMFGRGGEELEVLKDAGVPFEVVPGVTAATACAAYAGIPLTHRDHSASVRLSTGHRREGTMAPATATDAQTLVYYMGVSRIAELQVELLAAGWDRATPVAFVENGTRADQRVVLGTLERAAAVASDAKLRSPALLIVGATASLAAKLHWFGAPPVSPVEPARDVSRRVSRQVA